MDQSINMNNNFKWNIICEIWEARHRGQLCENGWKN